jgi:transcriptional regulator of acetoin/glycerol metabolism
LRQLGGRAHASALALPNGLQVWVSVRLPVVEPAAVVSARAPPSVAEAAPPTAPSLAEQERSAILAALRECGGNVSQAARRLGVSRGRVYRAMG